MNRAVVDASFVFALLVDRGRSGEAALRRSDAELHAPELLRYEVVEALRKVILREGIEEPVAHSALSTLSALPVVQWDFRPFAERIWDLRQNVSAYDASYVALAEHLDAPLLTFDRRLARAPGLRCEVIVPS